MSPSKMFDSINIIYLVYFAFQFISVAAEPRPDSPNVCNKTEVHVKAIKVPTDTTYEKDVSSTCVGGIIGCTKKRKVTIPSHKYEQRSVNLTKLACCEGFSEDQEKNCVPVCSNACIHGDCFKPEVCRCHLGPSESAPGWSGPTCNRFTCKSTNRWGSNCELECNCSSNGFCDANSGTCVCSVGWTGSDCSERCSRETGCKPSGDVVILHGNYAHTSSRSADPSTAEIVVDRSEVVEGNTARIVATHVGINLLLTVLLFGMLLLFLSYKRKLKAAREDLYYVTYSSSSGGSVDTSRSGHFENPVYSLNDTTIDSSDLNQTPVPPVVSSDSFPCKNQSFLSASRAAFGKESSRRTDGPMSGPSPKKAHYLVDPKVEYNLMTSKKEAQENLYSEFDKLEQIPIHCNVPDPVPNNNYQVPRSPVRVPNDPQYQDVDSNIYEEINTEKIYRRDS